MQYRPRRSKDRQVEDQRQFIYFDTEAKMGFSRPAMKTLAEWLADIKEDEAFADTIMAAKELRRLPISPKK